MVGAGQRRQRRERAGALEHALGVVRVQADALPLGRAQRPGLVPDPVRHGHPAEVVQEARGADLRHLGPRAAERPRRPSAASSATRAECPCRNVELDVGELAERAGDRSPAPRPRPSRPARGSASMTRSHASGASAARSERARARRAPRRRPPGHSRARGGARAPDRRRHGRRARAIATRSWATQTIRTGREICSPASFARQPLAVPALHELPERDGDRLGQVQASREQRAALAQVRRHQLEPFVPAASCRATQARALGQRPVVREAAERGGAGPRTARRARPSAARRAGSGSRRPRPSARSRARRAVQPTCARSAT